MNCKKRNWDYAQCLLKEINRLLDFSLSAKDDISNICLTALCIVLDKKHNKNSEPNCSYNGVRSRKPVESFKGMLYWSQRSLGSIRFKRMFRCRLHNGIQTSFLIYIWNFFTCSILMKRVLPPRMKSQRYGIELSWTTYTFAFQNTRCYMWT